MWQLVFTFYYTLFSERKKKRWHGAISQTEGEREKVGEKGFPDGASGKEPACQSRGHKRQGFDPCVRNIPWKRAWHSYSVFLPGESPGQRSLGGQSSWVCQESDITKRLNTHTIKLLIMPLRGVGKYLCATHMVAQMVKNPPAMQETWVPSLGQKDLLEEEMATNFSILALEIWCTKVPGELQSTRLSN